MIPVINADTGMAHVAAEYDDDDLFVECMCGLCPRQSALDRFDPSEHRFRYIEWCGTCQVAWEGRSGARNSV